MSLQRRRVYAPAPANNRPWSRINPALLQAVASAGGRAVSNYAAGYFKRKGEMAANSSSKKRKVVGTATGKVLPDGTSSGKFVVAKKRKIKKGKQSLVKRVRALEKIKPSKSVRDYKVVLPVKMRGKQNEDKWFQRDAHYHLYIENCLADMEYYNVDTTPSAQTYLTENTKVMVKNAYYSAELKNSKTGNVHIEYAFMKVVDDDDESFLKNVSDCCVDRGLNAGTLEAQAGPTATASQTPQAYIWQSNTMFEARWTGRGMSSKYKNVSGVQKAVLGPGDTLKVFQRFKDHVYMPEIKDRENFTYLTGDYLFVIRCYGDLAHDETNHNLVARTEFALDCVETFGFKVEYIDGKGLEKHMFTNYTTNTGITTLADVTPGAPSSLVHADNYTSAVEKANE